jgi:hypothetical protein
MRCAVRGARCAEERTKTPKGPVDWETGGLGDWETWRLGEDALFFYICTNFSKNN